MHYTYKYSNNECTGVQNPHCYMHAHRRVNYNRQTDGWTNDCSNLALINDLIASIVFAIHSYYGVTSTLITNVQCY